MTTQEAEHQVLSELESGERLLWSGVPRQGLVLRSRDAFLIPFSLLWGGFAFFWEGTVLRSGGPTFFALWGIPFVIMGVYLIVGRFFVDSVQRSRTAYGVTDRRILILSGLLSKTVKSLSVKTLADVSLTEKADRSGTISFGSVQWYSGAAWPGARSYLTPSFDMIANAKEVYAQIRQVQVNS